MESLEKVDMIRNRLGVSYEKAYQALQEADGDVLEALIKLEGESEIEYADGIDNQLRVRGNELIDKIKEIIKEGNVNKIIVKNKEKTLVEIPVSAGVVSMVLFPYITVLAGMAAMFKDYTLEIDRKKGIQEDEDVKE